MENIIEKLTQIKTKNSWKNWTLEEKKKLLDMYYIISTKESHIFDLIFSYHGCDSWEDIFRDYDVRLLEDKAEGVKMAIMGIEDIEQTRKRK